MGAYPFPRDNNSDTILWQLNDSLWNNTTQLCTRVTNAGPPNGNHLCEVCKCLMTFNHPSCRCIDHHAHKATIILEQYYLPHPEQNTFDGNHVRVQRWMTFNHPLLGRCDHLCVCKDDLSIILLVDAIIMPPLFSPAGASAGALPAVRCGHHHLVVPVHLPEQEQALSHAAQ
jgi:hypothetical protein